MNIIAASKVGKSWFANDQAMCVATGKEWLDKFSTGDPGAVLYVDSELHPETLAHRLRDVQEQREFDEDMLEENFFPVCLRGEIAKLQELRLMIEAITASGRKLKAVVLDAWYRFMPDSIDENSNSQMTQLYNMLDALALKHDCCFVIIHHSSKGNQTDKSVTDVGSGAGAMSRAADTHLVIRPHEEERLYVVDAAVRSFAPVEPFTLVYCHPCWDISNIEPVLKQKKSAAVTRKEVEDAAVHSEAIEVFGVGKVVTSSEFRGKIGMGNDRATRILRNKKYYKDIGSRPGKQKNSADQTLFKILPKEDATFV